MKNKRNYYRILHVQPDAPVELIKMSYRTIMQKLKKHPDLGGDEWDASVINEAYAVLSDVKLRAAYDARLLRERSMSETAQQSQEQRAGSASDIGGAAESEFHSASNDEPGNESKHSEPHQHDKEEAGSDKHCLFCGAGFTAAPNADSDCLRCASPLMRLDTAEFEKEGKRIIQRQPSNSPIEFWAFWPAEKQQAVLLDLSLHGFKLRLAHALHAGHVLKVENSALTATARVAHCVSSEPGFLVGARFLTLRFASARGTFVHTSV